MIRIRCEHKIPVQLYAAGFGSVIKTLMQDTNLKGGRSDEGRFAIALHDRIFCDLHCLPVFFFRRNSIVISIYLLHHFRRPEMHHFAEMLHGFLCA